MFYFKLFVVYPVCCSYGPGEGDAAAEAACAAWGLSISRHSAGVPCGCCSCHSCARDSSEPTALPLTPNVFITSVPYTIIRTCPPCSDRAEVPLQWVGHDAGHTVSVPTQNRTTGRTHDVQGPTQRERMQHAMTATTE